MITDYIHNWFKAHIKSIPEIKNVEMDFEQDEAESGDENQIITTPCVLIDLTDEADTSDLGNFAQEGEMDVRVRLITHSLRHKDDRIRKPGKENHFDIARKLYKKLQRIQSGKLSDIEEFAALKNTELDFNLIDSISRTGAGFDNELSKYVRSSMTFRIRFNDYSASIDWQKVEAEACFPDIDILPNL